jgi:hypothetical protein
MHRMLTVWALSAALSLSMPEDGATPEWVRVFSAAAMFLTKPLDVLWRSSPDITMQYGNAIAWANSGLWAVALTAAICGFRWLWKRRRSV